LAIAEVLRGMHDSWPARHDVVEQFARRLGQEVGLFEVKLLEPPKRIAYGCRIPSDWSANRL
jgi:hypothetical protein